MDYNNAHILVLGAGESGIGAAHVLAQLGAYVVLNDYKKIELPTDIQTMLNQVGVSVISGRQDESLLDDVDRIIMSPGISLDIPIVKAAKERGIEVVSEVELAYDISKSPILGVTGTNGKTTTTTLLTEVMKASGKPVLVGGNIGESLSEMAYKMPEGGYLIAELSSYQLESIKNFHPLGAIVLNISPDHLERHKTMENYVLAKENIFKAQTPSDYLVLNEDDTVVLDMVNRAQSNVLYISQKHEVENGAYYENGHLYAVQAGKKELILEETDIHIPGMHNIENILTVIALTYALGVSTEIIRYTISMFTGVEHRLERVATINSVTYYNDSKATNVDSVVKALEAFSKPVILLMGGHDKMTPVEDFMVLVKEKAKELILMGEAAYRFEVAARTAGISCIHHAQSMREAVCLSHELAEPEDIVLLSPACSSYDWYSCFEERGEDFKKEVLALEERR